MLIKLFYINIDPLFKSRILYIIKRLFQAINVEFNITEIMSEDDIDKSLMEDGAIVLAGDDITYELFDGFTDKAMLTDYKADIVILYHKQSNLHYFLPIRPFAFVKYNESEKELIHYLKIIIDRQYLLTLK